MRVKNQKILLRSREHIEKTGASKDMHQKRLKRWGDGPDITADTLFWKALEQHDVSLPHFIAELTWARREYGIGAIQSPQSWGKIGHQYYCPESLPTDFPHLVCSLGMLKNGLLSIRYLAIGSKKYQVTLLSTGDGTSLYIATKQGLSDTQASGLKGARLGTIVENLQDDRIIKEARTAKYQGKASLRLILEDQHHHQEIVQYDVQPPVMSVEQSGWPGDKMQELHRIVASAKPATKPRRSLTTVKPYMSTAPGGRESHYALITERKLSKIPYEGELCQIAPTSNARWDHRHRSWAIPMNELLDGDLSLLCKNTQKIIVS